MAATPNAIRVQAVLQVKNGNLQYSNRPGAFNASMTGTNGPTPGTVLIGVNHTVISLAQLTSMGGMCRVLNLDPTNFVTLGTYSAHYAIFLPFMDLLPGEEYVFRLSQFLSKDLTPATGTGPIDAFGNQLSAKADIAPVRLQVDAFDP